MKFTVFHICILGKYKSSWLANYFNNFRKICSIKLINNLSLFIKFATVNYHKLSNFNSLFH